MLSHLHRNTPNVVGVSESGASYVMQFADGSSRAATAAEVLEARKLVRIEAINAECRARLLARYGTAEEQVSRSIGVYGATEQAAMPLGIAATVDASNTASNAVIAAADEAAVEAVTVTWPVI
jgi:hypothetical protein